MDDKDRPREPARSLMDEAILEFSEAEDNNFENRSASEIAGVVEFLYHHYTCFDKEKFTPSQWRQITGATVPSMAEKLAIVFFKNNFTNLPNVYEGLQSESYEWDTVYSVLHQLDETGTYYAP